MLLDSFADFDFLLEIDERASLVEEDLKHHLQTLIIGGSCGDMHLAIREDWVFSVHEFIEKHTEGIGIVVGIMARGISLELAVIKVRNICPVV